MQLKTSLDFPLEFVFECADNLYLEDDARMKFIGQFPIYINLDISVDDDGNIVELNYDLLNVI